MEVLTNVKDILQMARDERFSGYTAELLVKDLNELIALREAGEKIAERLRVTRNWAKTSGFENADLSFTMEDAAALEAWEAANK